MAYAFRRENKGSVSFTGMYQGIDGKYRSAGTFPSRRAALRAAQREEQLVLDGRWRDRRLGEMPFADFVENVWWPSKHLELIDPGRVPVQPRHALPAVLRPQADGQDPAVVDSGVGDQGHRGRPGSQVGPQVPHGAALDLRTRRAGRDDLDQPLCPHRAAEDHHATDPNLDPGGVRPADRRGPGAASADGRRR